MNNTVSSQVQTPGSLVRERARFVIPSYQRPYVWADDDVKDLLKDIVDAHDRNLAHYYLGTVLTSATREGSDMVYELIDGQQRMTTVMLLALAIERHQGKGKHAMSAFVLFQSEPRLTFAIREQVQQLFGSWAGVERYSTPTPEELSGNPFLKHLAAAMKTLGNYLDTLCERKSGDYLEGLSQYVFERVRWVNNVMPAGMDLNRLFTTLNNSGVQLEQSDILKARLLSKITHLTARYDAIWQACENMGDYFERNVRKVFPGADWAHLKFDQLASFSPQLFPLRGAGQDQEPGITLAELDKRERVKSSAQPAGDPQVRHHRRSIISFSLLLMHTYRIFRWQQGLEDVETVRLHDSRLNEFFADFVSTADARQARKFIRCLWQVRYQFDRWVVKWAPEADSDVWHLGLAQAYKDTTEKRLARRTLAQSNLSQLQSVRYFTGERSAQYWLTPFLGWLVAEPHNANGAEKLLEWIDNSLSLADSTQKAASFALLADEDVPGVPVTTVLETLREPRGTRFEHYWFQKLEYILWKEQQHLGFPDPDKLAAYRVASKNSVEHVHPRNEEFQRTLAPILLDGFGNLVLLSPAENSAYSNLSILRKRELAKMKPRYESLKLALLFADRSDEPWEQVVQRHQRQMLELVETHYQRAG